MTLKSNTGAVLCFLSGRCEALKDRPLRRIGLGMTLLGAVSVSLTACGNQPDAQADPQGIAGLQADAEQADLPPDSKTLAILSDGVVTLEEYHAAVADNISCLEGAGLDVSNRHTNKLDGWRELSEVTAISGPMDEAASARVNECSTWHTMYPEIGYGMTHEGHIDESLLADATMCLTEAGYAPQSGMNVTAVTDTNPSGDRQAVVDCLWVSKEKLYPNDALTDAH